MLAHEGVEDITQTEFSTLTGSTNGTMPVSTTCGEDGSSHISNAVGMGCLSRIMKEGWAMNY